MKGRVLNNWSLVPKITSFCFSVACGSVAGHERQEFTDHRSTLPVSDEFASGRSLIMTERELILQSKHSELPSGE